MAETTGKQVGLTNAQLDAIAHESSVDPALLADGFELVEREKSANFREAITHHWRAVLWSALLSMALVMDSFDGSLVRLVPLHGMTHVLGLYSSLDHCTACPHSKSGSATS
jgi:hypothetical protein